MAQKLKHQQNEGGSNVVALGSAKCSCDGCNKKSDLMSFCKEHYDWYKFGLITKEGKKPIDFDKKFTAYQRRAKAA